MLVATFSWLIYLIAAFVGLCVVSYFKLRPVMQRYGLGKFTVWAGALSFILLSFLLTYSSSLAIWRYYPKTSFDQAKWWEKPDKRYKMTEDLIARELLIGKNRSDVEKWLGTTGRENQRNERWKYYTGRLPGPFSLLPHVIDIEFKEGTVVRVTQYDDRH
ncbi:hypothetical protein [Pontibacter lucknowensis]|uniref:SmpA / OmlA family protein n=1 Tax=Pontibacter lucknowensis TaxID=1077936 RepID=A0A1N6ZZ07_9BACT|nr:hypothetical protein [Pontibacter lucknowensis]SIR31989.1 hypothetical protein SAMN05421545_3108 [Pontibacter lucknowensis]